MRKDFLETEAVRQVMEIYFDAVYRADIDTLKTLFHEKAAMYGYLGPNMLAGTPQPFLDDIGGKPSMLVQGIDCRCVIRHLTVTGRIASVTLLVDGFYGVACVEDQFHLLKDGDEWKIVCKTFTTVD